MFNLIFNRMKKHVFLLMLAVSLRYFSFGQELIKNGDFSLPDNGTEYQRIDSIPNWCTDALTGEENGRAIHEGNPVCWAWDEGASVYQVVGDVPSVQTTYTISFDVTCFYTWWGDYVTDLYVIFSTFTGTDTTSRFTIDTVKFTYDCKQADWFQFANRSDVYVLEAGNAHAGEHLAIEIKMYNSLLFGYDHSYTYLWYDNVSVIQKSVSGIPEKQNTSLKVFPVPASGVIHISNDALIETITLFDVAGKEVLRETVNRKDVALNINHIDSGIYFMNVRLKDKSFTQKVIIE
jgi:hypothetical protein